MGGKVVQGQRKNLCRDLTRVSFYIPGLFQKAKGIFVFHPMPSSLVHLQRQGKEEKRPLGSRNTKEFSIICSFEIKAICFSIIFYLFKFNQLLWICCRIHLVKFYKLGNREDQIISKLKQRSILK